LFNYITPEGYRSLEIFIVLFKQPFLFYCFTNQNVTKNVNALQTTPLLQSKKISGRDPQGAWHQDELIVGKLPVIK
jgi:hypothetical protein